MEIKGHFGVSERIIELIDNLTEMDKVRNRLKKTAVLKKAGWTAPLSVLPLAIFSNSYGIDIDSTSIDPGVSSYLDTIQFPKGTQKMEIGKRYLPITRLPCVEEDLTLGQYEECILEQVVNRECHASFKSSLKYLTSELVNNVNEHARIDHYWLLAQYWPKTEICEIVIADTGIGYRASYEGTAFEVKNDHEAIINALEGKSSKKMPVERGTGIPSLSKIFIEGYGGKLVIMSGKAIKYYKGSERKSYDLPCSWPGSLVCINFGLKSLDLYKYLE